MEFRIIKDFPNYAVSNTGVVINIKTGKVKAQYKGGEGYYITHLWKDNTEKLFHIHSLVAKAWVANPDNKPVVDHINRDKTDNRAENLRWVTYSENNMNMEGGHGHQARSIIVTRYSEDRDKYGSHISFGEPVEVKEYELIRDAAEELGCTQSNITLMLRSGNIGRRGKCRGLRFEYKESVTTIESTQ